MWVYCWIFGDATVLLFSRTTTCSFSRHIFRPIARSKCLNLRYPYRPRWHSITSVCLASSRGTVKPKANERQMIKSADFVGHFYRATKIGQLLYVTRLILSADISVINLAVKLVLISPRKLADKIGRFYRSPVIGFTVQCLQLHVKFLILTEAQPRWHSNTTIFKCRQPFADYRTHRQSLLPIWEINLKACTLLILEQISPPDPDSNPGQTSRILKYSAHCVKPLGRPRRSVEIEKS